MDVNMYMIYRWFVRDLDIRIVFYVNDYKDYVLKEIDIYYWI